MKYLKISKNYYIEGKNTLKKGNPIYPFVNLNVDDNGNRIGVFTDKLLVGENDNDITKINLINLFKDNNNISSNYLTVKQFKRIKGPILLRSTTDLSDFFEINKELFNKFYKQTKSLTIFNNSNYFRRAASELCFNYNIFNTYLIDDNNILRIPKGTIVITKRSFAYLSRVLNNETIKVFIPNSVREIQYAAFKDSNITEIIFENNSQLEKIGIDAFASNQITSLSLPDSVKILERGCFRHNLLTSVHIPIHTLHVKWKSFYENNLTDVYFDYGLNELKQGYHVPLFLSGLRFNKSYFNDGHINIINTMKLWERRKYYNNVSKQNIILKLLQTFCSFNENIRNNGLLSRYNITDFFKEWTINSGYNENDRHGNKLHNLPLSYMTVTKYLKPLIGFSKLSGKCKYGQLYRDMMEKNLQNKYTLSLKINYPIRYLYAKYSKHNHNSWLINNFRYTDNGTLNYDPQNFENLLTNALDINVPNIHIKKEIFPLFFTGNKIHQLTYNNTMCDIDFMPENFYTYYDEETNEYLDSHYIYTFLGLTKLVHNQYNDGYFYKYENMLKYFPFISKLKIE